ncbi:MAG: alpha-hydroxy-acid oxidizing protein, partial [Chloroflexota bacterium]
MSVAGPDVDLERVVRLSDFEAIAAERMEPAAFDYVAGGAWDEVSLAEAPEAWRRTRLRPRVLVDVAEVDASTTLLGAPTALPVAIAPMAAQGLAHPDAELAVARAAASAGVPVVVSTMATWSLEEIAAAAPDAMRWFQLYTQAESRRTRSLVDRAAAAGYEA